MAVNKSLSNGPALKPYHIPEHTNSLLYLSNIISAYDDLVMETYTHVT